MLEDAKVLANGECAARSAMASLGRPGAVAWLQINIPESLEECPQNLPMDWWIGFDRELCSVAGTA